jgi:hypothetical protein
MPTRDHSIAGDPANFRGLVYAPLNENGVIFLFGTVAGDLSMYVEEIKPGFRTASLGGSPAGGENGSPSRQRHSGATTWG